MEIWKDIPQFEGIYQISNLGRMKSLTQSFISKKDGRKWTIKGKILKTPLSSTGYPRKICKHNGISKGFKIHRLVASTFIPNPKNKPFINHKNGIKTDNTVSNLEWCTHKENMDHALKNGLLKILSGENHKSSKLTWKQVDEIRNKYKKNTYGYKALAQEYNVTPPNIKSIIENKTWKVSISE